MIYGAGADADRVLQEVVNQCSQHGVYAEPVAIDEYPGDRIFRFSSGAVLVLPSVEPIQQGADSGGRPLPKRFYDRSSLGLFVQVAEQFRKIKPVTAAEGFVVGSNSDLWKSVGVLQAVHPEFAMTDPAGRRVLELACASHLYRQGEPFTGNLFEVLKAGKAQTIKQDDQVTSAEARLWHELNRWGVRDGDFAQTIRNALDVAYRKLDNPKKRALHRPIAGMEYNRLELLAYFPDKVPARLPEQSDKEYRNTLEKYRDNGARALRDLLHDLEESYPPFRQPKDLQDTRDAQKRFVRFFDSLRTVTSNS